MLKEIIVLIALLIVLIGIFSSFRILEKNVKKLEMDTISIIRRSNEIN